MAVKVRRERPDQRRHHRVTAPLYVEVAGQSHRAADWSLGGLRVDGFEGELPGIGSEIALGLMLPFQGFDVSFEVKAEIVRRDRAAKMFAVRFTEIGERERELMSHFIEELVRGSMVDVEDTIQRIDVPVTPASLEPDKPRLQQMPVKRWPLKTVGMSGLYLTLGLMIFGYASLIGYTNFFRMEVQTAVIQVPVETVVAQADGRVVWGERRPGDAIRAGESIVAIIDGQLEREIELADIAVKERKARLAFLKQRHAEELERIRGYATVEMKNIQQTRIELEALQSQLRSSEEDYKRIKGLHAKGFATDSRIHELERQVIAVRKELDLRRVELVSRVELAEQNLGKRMFTGNATIGSADITGKGAELEAEVRLAEHEIQLAQQRQISWLNQKSRAGFIAPFDGVILDLPRPDQASVRKGDVIAVVEQRTKRHVTAFLNQDEILKVGVGDEVLIYVPALDETTKGRVTAIDRTSGFIREQGQARAPGYSWRGPTDRSAQVTIAFEEPRKVADHERYRSGLPVVAVFEQRSTNALFSAIKRSLSLAL
jgi:multidrug resistance efflux pump